MRITTFFLLAMMANMSLAGDFEINTQQRLLQAKSDVAIPMGATVKGLAFKDTKSKTHRLKLQQATALVFLSTSCPLAKRYTQRLNRLHNELASQGADVVGVFPNEEDSTEAVRNHAQQMKFVFPVVKDHDGYIARRVGAKMTPQVVVLDADGVLRYRGAIDDNRYENRVKQHYLHDAVVAVLKDESVAVSATKCVGCSIHFPKPESSASVTYTEHVARILQDNCQSCHRPEQVAPFALTSYGEAKTWSTEIAHYTKARLMPPWKAAPDFGDFHDERSLSEESIALIQSWVADGTPEGPTEAMPPQPEFPDQWQMGEPDHIVEMPEEYTIGPEGEDDYRHFIIPTDFDQDMYVSASDVIPGNRQTVHHVIAYVDTSGVARKLDAADPGPGYTRFGDVGFEPVSGVGGWAPGTAPAPTPDGTGFWLPKGADIVMQVHYYRTGREEKDRTKLGLYFSKHPNPQKIGMGIAINPKFMIPPGDANHEVKAVWDVKEDSYAISVAPHMHLIGKQIKVEAFLPDGSTKRMIWIKAWDFNWQGSYRFREPMFLPKGTKVVTTAHFDNSAENPNNPNSPPKPVGWGEKTTDEMCIAFVAHLKAKEWKPKSDASLVSAKSVSKSNPQVAKN